MRFERDAIGDEPRCLQCDRKVDPETARVLGDNDNNVPTCRECRDPESNNKTQSDSRAVVDYYSEVAGSEGRP